MEDLNISGDVGEWRTKYNQLLQDHRAMVHENDGLRQDNYNLKRDLLAVENSNKYLNEDIEALESEKSKFEGRINEIRCGFETRIEGFRQKNEDLAATNESLSQKIEHLNEELQQAAQSGDKSSTIVENQTHESSQIYEEELRKYRECILEIETELKVANSKVDALEPELAAMKEKVDWLETTLENKKEELTEKCEQVDTLQEKNIELMLELNMLRSAESHKEKGNSLFAEVDDQRQIFRKMLQEQSDQFQQMKKIYQDSLYEIRRLKHENQEILSQMEACKSLFLSAKPIHKEGLLDRISILEQIIENHEHSSKIVKKGGDRMEWCNVLLNQHRSETKNLKDKLCFNLQIKSNLEENLMKRQQECANLKLEMLELRMHLRKAKSQCTTDFDDKENLPEELPSMHLAAHINEMLKSPPKTNAVSPPPKVIENSTKPKQPTTEFVRQVNHVKPKIIVKKFQIPSKIKKPLVEKGN